MSYDLYLVDPETGEPLHAAIPHHFRGGTYVLGGTTELHLNITYNYSPFFRRVLGEAGIREIYGMTGAESRPILQHAADQLAGDADADYWKPTEGNAKIALLTLVTLASMAMHGVWKGD